MVSHAGFDTLLGIANMNEESIAQVEDHINSKGNEIIDRLDCCHSIEYKNSITEKLFKFLPGHRKLIIEVGKIVANSTASNEQDVQSQITHLWNTIEQFGPVLPNILKELIQTALENSQTSPNLNKYSDVIKYFAIYVYLMCGKQCYEILNSNLAMPAASTIGM